MNGKKIYVASSFSLVPTVKMVADSLKKCGYIITQEWWRFDYKSILKNDDELWYLLPKVRNISKANFEAIKRADCLLLVADSETPQRFNGANIELGYALALGKPCFSIGKLQRSAMYVPVTQCSNLKEVLEKLNIILESG